MQFLSKAKPKSKAKSLKNTHVYTTRTALAKSSEMYQSSPYSSHAMVHLVGGYHQTNGQFLPLQSQGYYANSPTGAHQDYNQFNRNGSNHNRQRVTNQQGTYQHDFSQRYNNGHKVHSSNYGLHHSTGRGGAGDASSGDWAHRLNSPVHNNNNNNHLHSNNRQLHNQQQHYGPATPQRSNHSSSNNRLTVSPAGVVGTRVNNYYRSVDSSTGKRSNWHSNGGGGGNKLIKRHQTSAYQGQYQQPQAQAQQPPLAQQQHQQLQLQDSASCSNSDSGFSSRSPTPSKHYKEGSLTESSDERDSLHSTSSEPRTKQNRIIRTNHGRGNLVTSVSTSNLYQGQRQLNENTTQNQQNRRKYSTSKTSPNAAQRQRGKKFNATILPEIHVHPKLICSPAERFIEESYLLQYRPPTNLLTGSPYDKLSKAVWEKFEQNQLSHTTFLHKMYLWRHLFFFIKTRFPHYGLLMVGSTLNGFGTDGSDMDMCLYLRELATDHRNEALSRLSQIMACLRRSDFVTHLELIQARVPILKIHERAYNLDVDLNFNNVVGIRNTHLMYCYSRIDWRVRPLVLIVKMWAQCQNINDARNMTLSSYSLVLMVIHFLQSGINPPVLPCLHNLYKEKFHPFSDIFSIDIHEELDIPIDALQPINTQSLGELLIEFFRYYDSFDYDQYAISVRVAEKIPIESCRNVRSMKNDPFQWKYICIEEPFDFTNTARSVYDETVFKTIKYTFKQTYERLKETNDLNSIFMRLEDTVKEANSSNNNL